MKTDQRTTGFEESGRKLAREILESGYTTKKSGERVRAHSASSLPQCDYLVSLLKETNGQTSLEVGVAFAISSLCLLDVVREKGGKHILIDPFQHDRHWQGLGLQHIETAGLSAFTTFIEEDARVALPRLALSSATSLDFAYIDASKRLDDTLIFFFYIFKMLKIGGIIAFDDVASFPGIFNALRHILKMPGIRLHSVFGKAQPSIKRRLLRSALGRVPYSRCIFRRELIPSEVDLEITAQCVAVQKVSKDIGDWDFFVG